MTSKWLEYTKQALMKEVEAPRLCKCRMILGLCKVLYRLFLDEPHWLSQPRLLTNDADTGEGKQPSP